MSTGNLSVFSVISVEFQSITNVECKVYQYWGSFPHHKAGLCWKLAMVEVLRNAPFLPLPDLLSLGFSYGEAHDGIHS